jgi:bifunctional non-homologous end joining protein LigD
VARGALEVKQRMAEFGLKSFLKTTGGKGLHVVVPIAPRYGWPAIKAFSQAVAVSMAHDSPNRYVATMSKAARTGKVFIDYLRNEVTATSIAAFSVRTRPGAPVSLPVSWSDLSPGLPLRPFTVRTVPSTVQRREDPWTGFDECRQELPAAVLSALRIPTI